MEVRGGADIDLQPMEDPTPEQVDAPEGGCDPVRSLRWSRSLAGPVAPWREEPRLEQLDKLEKWAEMNLMKFSNGKVLHQEWNNPTQQYRLGTNWLTTGDQLTYKIAQTGTDDRDSPFATLDITKAKRADE
ncbi:AN1-type zinc finger protein 5-like [Grus japonensis]|uniref:AN1-type zinc finger protein 5-like n=1 Tax=Grus japonensis TaxID=30415 RepID=A0ABC9WF19_GRUJA